MKKIRINFDKKLRMDLVCSKDEMRPVFNYIYFKNGVAYATDSHILVANRLDECTDFPSEQIELLHDKYIHKDDYVAILKHDIISVVEDGFLFKDGNREIKYSFAKNCGVYPNAEELINKAKENIFNPVEKIGFNSKLLIKLQKAIYNGEKTSLFFKNESSGIIVKSNDKEFESVGLIMPLLINE